MIKKSKLCIRLLIISTNRNIENYLLPCNYTYLATDKVILKTLKSIFFLLCIVATVVVMAGFVSQYFTYMPMWDIMNYHYPFSSYVADALKQGNLPLWCPYAYLGAPIFSDPSTGFWYPVNMLVYYVFGFNAYVLKIEYALHLIIAGFGMYRLAKHFTSNGKIAVAAGVVFPLSGFFVSSAALFSFTYSFAWLPFVFLYYIKGCTTKQWKYFVYGGIAMALCVLSGYIVFAILGVYVLGFMFLYYAISQRHNSIQLLFKSSGMAVVSIVLCSGYLYSVFDSLPYQARGDMLGLHSVMDNPFSPQSLLSLILPFSTAVDIPFFDTDIAMRNMYMGIIALPLIYMALIYGNRKQNIMLLLIAVLFLLVSFGAYTPLRAWLYYNVPLMNMFRHPAIFRAGALLALLLLASQGLRVLYSFQHPNVKRHFAGATMLVALLIAIAFLLAIQHETIKLRFPDFTSIQSVVAFNNNNNVWANIIVQCAALGILLALVFIGIALFNTRSLAIVISLLWVLDVTLAAQMNIAATMVCNIPVKTFAEEAAKLPHNFPIPSQRPIVETVVMAPKDLSPMVYNTVIVKKELSHDGYNPFVLKSYKRFTHSALYEAVIQNPLAYTTSCIRPWSCYMTDSINDDITIQSVYADFVNIHCIDGANKATTTVTKFEPNAIAVKVDATQPTYLNLLQNYYPGWQCSIDGMPIDIIKTNFTFMAVKVPSGVHEISFEFKPPYVKLLVYIQIMLWLTVGVALLYYYVRQKLS